MSELFDEVDYLVSLDAAARQARLEDTEKQDPDRARQLRGLVDATVKRRRLAPQVRELKALDASAREAKLAHIEQHDPELAESLRDQLRADARVTKAPIHKKLAKLLRQLPPAVWLRETLTHAVLLGLAIWAGVTIPGLLAILLVEMVAISLLTPVLYPERGLVKVFVDLVQSVFGFAILSALALAAWTVARGVYINSPIILETVVEAFSGTTFLLGAGFAVAHLGIGFLVALRSPDPRKAWVGGAVLSSVSTNLGLVLQIFVLGTLGAALQSGMPPVQAEIVNVTLAVLCRYLVALVVNGVIGEKEIDEAAKNPYTN